MINIECEPKGSARGAVSIMGERNHWTCDETSVEPVDGQSESMGLERSRRPEKSLTLHKTKQRLGRKR